MKHKILTFALALLTAASAGAYDFKVNGLCYNILSSTEVEVTYENIESETSNYPALSGAVNIPASITYENNEYNVTGIGYGTFAYCSAISSVNIPTGIRYINSDAFDKCQQLSEIVWNVSSGNSEWWYNIFDDSPIRTVTFGESVQDIPNNVFTNMRTLSTINVLATTPPSITPSTFRGINTSATIRVPESSREAYLADPSWKQLLDMASGQISGTIGYNQNLTWTLTFADSTLTISGTGNMDYIDSENAWKTFSSSIAKVIIEEGVTNIANQAFDRHFSLREVTIPSSITSIGSAAFYYTDLYNNESNWTNGGLYINNCLIATSDQQMDETGHFTVVDGTRLIADDAFSSNSWLTGVTLPNSVVHIGESAFYACSQLAQITIPSAVTYISNSTFEGCLQLTQITIPAAVTYIGASAFARCPLSTITVLATTPPSITPSTFNGLTPPITLTIPEGSREAYLADPNWKRLLDIASGRISGTIGYEQNQTWTLTFADSTLTISGIGEMGYIDYENSWQSFSSSVAKVIIEEGITSIVYNAFYNHYNLREITIPNSVTSIERNAFYGTALYYNENNWTNGALYIDNCLITTSEQPTGETGHFTIADGTRIIANEAFSYRSWLTGITLPNSVTSIGERAFYNCNQLTHITLPSAVTHIGSKAFARCSLNTITVLATTPPTITTNTFSGLIPSATITIPEGSRDAYLADPNWKRLLDMASGQISGTIGYDQNLTWTLVFADSTLTISGTGEMGYINEYESWQSFFSSIAKVVIEEGVTSIANGAFYSHSNLREVTIPISVTRIENDAFYETALYNNRSGWTEGGLYIDNCLIATSEWQMGETGHFTIADGTRVIADNAFRYRNWLTGVTLPNSLTNIGERAFYNCNQLTQITLPSAVTHIGSEAFAGCSLSAINVLATNPPAITSSTFSGLAPSATITIPEGSREAYMADPNWKRLLDMASGEISGTFGDNQNLTWTLTFADSTLTISGTGGMGYIDSENSWKAFSSYVAKAVIEEGVTDINYEAFRYHENLREVTIPGSVTRIGSDAFYGTALYNNESNWTDGALYIDNCLVATREWLMDETGHFTVAGGTRIIADGAFSYRNWLTGVTIPNSVTHIGDYILRGCENLASITVLATTPPVITSYTFEGVNTGIQLTIPEGSTALYEADPIWNSFLQFCSGIISGTCGENLTWTLTLADNTLTISGTGDMYEKEQWGDHPLPWQQFNSYIHTVNITEGVTSISDGAFMSCYNLTDINIPNSINKIGANAFMNTQLYNDDSNWNNGALYIDNCLIATNSEAIGDYAITEGTRIIADGIFSYNYEYRDYLTGISIPASVTHIGDEAFAYCENLSVINVAAATPPVITDQTFYRISTNLQITVPAGSESLYLADPNWKRLFDIASGVVEGVCGDHLTWVLNLADSTLTISGYGDMYDYDVWNDETYFPMPWEEFIYDNIKNIILPDGITSIGDFAFLNDSYNMTSIHLPEGIRRIGKYAFAGNYGLTSISIPASVELIDTAAFYYCTELTAVQVNSNNRHYCSENGVLFNKDKSTLIIYPAKKQDSYYALPSNVKVIETAAFMSCQALTEIILPYGLTTISVEAFNYCTNLAEITIPNSVNYIGEYVLYETALYNDESNWTDGCLYWDNCLIATNYEIPASYTIPSGTRLIAGGTFNTSELREITIPASVISIGEESFNWCNNLQKMTVYAQIPPMLGANVFENVNRNIPLYVPAGSLERYSEAAIWNEFQLQAMPATDLQTTIADGFESLVITNGTLYNPVGLPISIFDMQGRLIYNGAESIVNMATGIYIVRIENSARKVFIP